MHTIQYIAVKADSVEEAHANAKSYLESQLGSGDTYNTWFDWFVVGGGRWATGDENQYNDDWTGDVVHQDSPKFQEYLDQAQQWKLESTMWEIKRAREIDISNTLDKIENDQEGLYPMWDVTSELYPLHKLYEATNGSWNSDSHFFDIEHEASHPKYMREAIDKGDKNWYLVPVDFHH